ncbi:ABC transporter ATP-binding protein [Alkalicaulis satelles]|uniref:ABC transporter ATP-binding protein n=1 Tax=Alkalicaulis satelles TaxID=2609175 RepID=A0A5M6ZLX0_9PROT|nr:ABC transporter ATP-binding protein [Alkalicaulis satelles]KAA5804915.1 ABC transporter ATP-binding protein [Alkalicaulis satelles]
MSEPVLSIRALRRVYQSGAEELEVLDGAELDLYPGELVGLVGPSGSGKSSLLHAAALLETPTAGQVIIAGQDGLALGERARTALRRREIGFVYQFHHLLPELSALENAALPLRIAGRGAGAAREAAKAKLEALGMGGRLDHRPGQLSGGEQQRVAIARALVNNPRVVLADEPTGNLDPAHSDQVFEALASACREAGAAALIATHNLALAERMDRVLTVEQGRLTPWTPDA